MKRFLFTVLFAILGGAVGFVAPLVVLVPLGVVLSWLHDDPAAGGVLSFLMIGLGPLCALAGIALAIDLVNRRYYPDKDKSAFDPGRRRFLTGMFGSVRKGE